MLRKSKRAGASNRFRLFCAVAFLGLFLAGGVSAAVDPSPKNEQPIEISSESLDADYARGTVRFLGSVVARQGNATIHAQELVIHFDRGTREIQLIEAFKNVRIVQRDRVATGQAARLERATGKVVLTGAPRIERGRDSVEGDEITYFLNEDRSVVKSKTGSRVNAVFHPREKTDGP
jgi:lipopolysaccharide export system protein LptA